MPPQPRSYSMTTPPRPMTEAEKRRRLLDKELGEVKALISPEKYEELLNRQREVTPVEDVDRALFGQGTQGATRQSQTQLSGLGASNTDMGIAQPNTTSRQRNQQAARAQGREFEFIPRQEGYEDRPSTYKEALEAGGYGKDFKDYIFNDSVFSSRRQDPRVMSRDDMRFHVRNLQNSLNEFEQVRQSLTENYGRMDPFARTQYNEMNKKINGLERARGEGRIREVEYLRAMDTLSTRARQVKWKYHMKAPGGQVGDVIDKDGNGMFYQRQPDGGMKLQHLSGQYVDQNTRQLDDGTWLVPEVKKGELGWTVVKGQAKPSADWKEKQEYTSKLESLSQDWMKKNYDPSIDDDTTLAEKQELALEYAKSVLSGYKDAADQLADPEAPNPRGNSDPRQLEEMKEQIAFEKGVQDAQQMAQQQWQQKAEARQRLNEAVMSVDELSTDREKSAVDVANQKIIEDYTQQMQQWMQENPEYMAWKQESMMLPPDQRPPQPPMRTEKPGKPPKATMKTITNQYSNIIDVADDVDDLRHGFAMLAQKDPAVKALLDRPVPVKRSQMAGGAADYFKEGIVYMAVGRDGEEQIFTKFKGKFIPLGKRDLNTQLQPQDQEQSDESPDVANNASM